MMVATRSIEECSASEISASEPIAIPTANFAAAMPPLAKIEIAATEVLLCWELMAGDLEGHGGPSNDAPQAQTLVSCRSGIPRFGRVGNGAERRAHHLSGTLTHGGHASLCPPY